MSKIEIFIYKIYYILFQYYSRYKRDIHWSSATIAIAVSMLSMNFSILWLTGLLRYMENLISPQRLSEDLSRLLFAAIFYILHYRLTAYILFERIKISKENGKTPLYEFTPTRKDQVSAVLYLAIALLSPLYITGIRVLFFE